VSAAASKPEAQGAVELSPVDQCLQQILADEDFPAISSDALEALKQIPDDETSIQRLANIVLREYALTVKVLRTANSAHYRRSDQHIRSAAHAMLLLGAGTVRHLAGSLLLFEHYRKRSPGLKELMLLSLLTANHAREVAMLRNLPDPEEANLCGMFRNLGEVLIAAYFPDRYAQVLQQMEHKESGGTAAAFDVLGFRFEELGEAMARHWGMPESVSAGIRAAGTQASSELFVITAFAHDLTTAVYRRTQDPSRDGVADVLARYAKRLKLSRDEVGAVLQSALQETRATFAAAGVSLDGLSLRRQQQAALQAIGAERLDNTPVAGGEAVPGVPGMPGGGAGHEAALWQLRHDLRAEVERMAQPESGEELGRVILMALEAAFRGGPFSRVVLLMMTTDRRVLKARYGLGDGIEAMLDRFTCNADSRTSPLAASVARRQTVSLPGDRDFTRIEQRFAQEFGAGSFVVFPLVIAGKQLGCLYCDRAPGSPIPDAGTLAHVRAVCDGVLRGIELRKSGSGRGGGSAVAGATGAGTNGKAGGEASGALHDVSFKRDAVLRLLRGEEVAVVAEGVGVPAGTLERWREAFLAGAVAGLSEG